MRWLRILWDMAVGFLLVYWAPDAPRWAFVGFCVINTLAWGLGAVHKASDRDLEDLAEDLK